MKAAVYIDMDWHFDFTYLFSVYATTIEGEYGTAVFLYIIFRAAGWQSIVREEVWHRQFTSYIMLERRLNTLQYPITTNEPLFFFVLTAPN